MERVNTSSEGLVPVAVGRAGKESCQKASEEGDVVNEERLNGEKAEAWRTCARCG